MSQSSISDDRTRPPIHIYRHRGDSVALLCHSLNDKSKPYGVPAGIKRIVVVTDPADSARSNRANLLVCSIKSSVCKGIDIVGVNVGSLQHGFIQSSDLVIVQTQRRDQQRIKELTDEVEKGASPAGFIGLFSDRFSEKPKRIGRFCANPVIPGAQGSHFINSNHPIAVPIRVAIRNRNDSVSR